MSELMNLDSMTSMEIAEIVGKEHYNIMRDIRDEVEKLESGGISSQFKFEFSERQDSTGRTIPYYRLSKEGVLQLAARYDAVVRSKLIDMAFRSTQPKVMTLKESLQMNLQLLEDNEKLQYAKSISDKIAATSMGKLKGLENRTQKAETIAEEERKAREEAETVTSIYQGQRTYLEPRKKFNSIIESTVDLTGIDYKKEPFRYGTERKRCYNDVYNRLLSPLNGEAVINLAAAKENSGSKSKGKLDFIKDDEWSYVIAIAAALYIEAGGTSQSLCKLVA